nr:MAG TPA: hypothetical protein [Caudoviricetes sp.]
MFPNCSNRVHQGNGFAIQKVCKSISFDRPNDCDVLFC